MGFDYRPHYGGSRLKGMDFDMHSTAFTPGGPDPVHNPDPAPTPQAHMRNEIPPFDPNMRPGSKAEGRDYVERLVNAIETRQISIDKVASMDFTGIDLHGADLKNINLKVLPPNALSRMNFANCDLTNQEFSGDMRGFHAPGANLSGATFTNAVLDGASFEGAKLDGTTFSGGSAVDAKFTKATGHNVHFNNISCQGASFAGASLQGQMTDVNMRNVKGRDFNMAGIKFDGPKMDFHGAEFQDATVSHEQMKMFKNPEIGVRNMDGMHVGPTGNKHGMGAAAHAWAGVIAGPSPFGTHV